MKKSKDKSKRASRSGAEKKSRAKGQSVSNSVEPWQAYSELANNVERIKDSKIGNRSASSTQKTPYNVLLIEANIKEAELYADMIRDVGECRLDTISRISDSYDWIAKGNYHLIVIDLSSFDQSASDEDIAITELSLLERIRSMSPATSVIILSEAGSVKDAVSAIRMGAEDYLKKPFNLEAFKLSVKRSLDSKMVFSEMTGASEFLHLLNSCQLISATLEIEKIFKIIQNYFSRELSSKHTAVYFLKDGQPGRDTRGARDDDFDAGLEEVVDIAVFAANPFAGMIESGETFRFIERSQLTPGLFVFRFRCAGKNDYFCVCLSPQQPDSIDAFRNRVQLLKRQIEVTGNNIRQYMGVQHLVYVDDATGLYNTRYMHFILEQKIEQSNHRNQPFAVLFIDGDHFKKVNDKHGHLVGTRILNEMGHELKKLVRESDTVFRYGGDEFVAILAPCDHETAMMVADRIRSKMEDRNFLEQEKLNLNITVSIGVALFPEHASTKEEIIAMADHAMYEAKKESRNRVYIVDQALVDKVKSTKKKVNSA